MCVCSRRNLSLLAGIVVLCSPAMAQVASALLQEESILPGSDSAVITGFDNTAVNHAGGYAVLVTGSVGGDNLSHIWGNGSGGVGDVISVQSLVGISINSRTSRSSDSRTAAASATALMQTT